MLRKCPRVAKMLELTFGSGQLFQPLLVVHPLEINIKLMRAAVY
jgi:hypothetical protein